jgi:twitching motility two-component system response regulator PilG
MNQDFQPVRLLKDQSAAGKTGHLQITANAVTWKLYLVKGKLQYAHYSLQSVEIIKHYLLRLNDRDAAAKVLSMLGKDTPGPPQLISVTNLLIEQNDLSPSQRTMLMGELTQDALESFLWLTQGEYQWNSTNTLPPFKGTAPAQDNLSELLPLLEFLQTRLQAWQKLRPLITSPHQRPLCVNPSLLQQKVPGGTLSPLILEKLVNLMRGATIRQLGLFLKQDDLRVAQLLFPYVKHRVLQLVSPKIPLDRLPPIPLFLPNSPPRDPRVDPITTAPVESKSKIHKIVCIDDSPTMLTTIENYLGNKKYEVFTVEDPMKSLSCLFDSKPELILMDFSMPGIDGNRLCQILRKSSVFKNTPIIMVSGNTKLLELAKLRAAGITDFLAKPFTKEGLLAMVEKYLEPHN